MSNTAVSLAEGACMNCIDIFESMDSLEMYDQAIEIRNAWLTGQELSAIKTEKEHETN